MDQALNQKIDAYIAENKEQLLQDIAALVAIDSVLSSAARGPAPKGAPSSGVPSTLSMATSAAMSCSSCSLFSAIYASIF